MFIWKKQQKVVFTYTKNQLRVLAIPMPKHSKKIPASKQTSEFWNAERVKNHARERGWLEDT